MQSRFLCGQQRHWSDWGMPRLIWVFAGCTSHFVGFVMLWLNSHLVFNRKKVYSLIDKSGNLIENRTGKSKNFILNFYLIFVPMMEGHIAFGLSVHPSFSLSRFLMHTRVLNFHIWISHEKYLICIFFLSELCPFMELCPFEKIRMECLKTLSADKWWWVDYLINFRTKYVNFFQNYSLLQIWTF